MRKQFKRTIALILVWVMMISSIIPNFADGYLSENETSKNESVLNEEYTSLVGSGENKGEEVVISSEEDDGTTIENEEKESDDEESEEKKSDEIETIESTTEESESEKESKDGETEASEAETSETEDEVSESLIESEETTATENIESSSKDEETTETETIIDEEIIATESEIIEKEIIATESEIEEKEFNVDIDVLKSPVATNSETTNDHDESLGKGYMQDDFIAPMTKKPRFKLFGSGLSSYDSRNETNPANTSMSIVPPVRAQGGYNTCWAFATIGLFEISIRKQGFVTNEADSNLSEAAMAYFTYDLKNVTNNTNYIDKPGVEGNDYNKVNSGNFATIGGNTTRATLVASSYVGVVKEDEETRYENLSQMINRTQNNQEGISGQYAFKKNAYVLGNAIYINKSDKESIKQAIQDYGAVAFAYKGEGDTSSFVHQVGSEYYYYTGYENVNSNDPSVRVNYADHAIIMVGWDDNIAKENFYTGGTTYETATRKATHNGGWLCRNSWGESEFNGGYFWLSYDEGTIDNTLCAIEAAKPDKYEYNYHYDTTSYPGAMGYGNIRYGNIFKVSDDSDQILDAVSVALGSANTKFDIEIYTKNTSMNTPVDGTRVLLKQNITKTFAGVYTIELEDSEKVKLKKGTYYSVILRARESEGTFRLWIDNYYSSSINNYNEAALKQSFVGHSGGWNDINVYNADLGTANLVNISGKTYGMNWRLKALTNKAVRITFDANGADNTMDYQIIRAGVIATISNCTLTKNGYIFDGWKDASENEWDDGAEINLTSDKTLIAKWRPISYRINYNTNGGTVTPIYETKYYGIDIVQLATPSKAQHEFVGWYVNYDSATNTFTNRYDGKSDLTSTQGDDKNIYAKWNQIYTITLYDEGGSPMTLAPDYIHRYKTGTRVILPTNIPDKADGRKFAAWYDNASYTGERYKEISTTDSGDKEFHARFAIAHMITFAAGGGTGNMPEQTMYEGIDDKINANVFTRSGYSFTRWIASNGATYSQNQVINITEDITLTAEWKKNSGGWSPGGGGTGGGGGGGGGGTLPANLPNAQMNQTTLSVDMSTVAINYNTAISNWLADDKGKWHLYVVNALGQVEDVKNSWACINNVVTDAAGVPNTVMDFYYFDNGGNMLTGWLSDINNKKYYLESNNNSEIGKMVRGWKKIDNKYYYFDSFGVLFVNGVTPDGYTVDANGEWKQ